MRHSGELAAGVTGEPFRVEVTVDTNGIGRDLGLEMVVYRQQDGQESLARTDEFSVAKVDGNIVTYELKTKIHDAGVFRSASPLSQERRTPHRRDFAFTRWI